MTYAELMAQTVPTGLLTPLTPAELRELDARMHAAQHVGDMVWPATWLGSGLNADITYVRREINAALFGDKSLAGSLAGWFVPGVNASMIPDGA